MNTMDVWTAKLSPIFCKHRVAVAYLFGSYALGMDDHFSDFDLAVVLFELPGEDWWRKWNRLSEEIEPLLETKELDLVFLQRAPVLLQWQVITEGKVLYCADEEVRLSFEEQVIGEWLDFSEWLKRFQKEMVEGILKVDDNA